MPEPLRDQRLNQQLTTHGYCVADVADDAILSGLASLYDEQRCDLRTGFHADMFSSDVGYRKATFDAIRASTAPLVDRLFADFRICLANYLVKEPDSPDSAVQLHQDWTLLEPPLRSYNVFIPLCDVNEEIGCLSVVPGSHESDRISAAPFNQLPVDDVAAEIHRHHLVSVPMTVGQCLLYDGRLIHCSPPNRTSRRRVVVGMIVVPQTASLRLYYQQPESDADVLEVFAVDDDFFTEFDLFGYPEGLTRLGEVPAAQPPITMRELRAWCGQPVRP